MDSRKFVIKQTLLILAGQAVCVAAMLGIFAKVRIVSPKSITRSEGKAVRVIDKRKI